MRSRASRGAGATSRPQTRRDAAADRLFGEVGRYLKAVGGNALVAGPISVESAGFKPHRFRLVVEFVGHAPASPVEGATA